MENYPERLSRFDSDLYDLTVKSEQSFQLAVRSAKKVMNIPEELDIDSEALVTSLNYEGDLIYMNRTGDRIAEMQLPYPISEDGRQTQIETVSIKNLRSCKRELLSAIEVKEAIKIEVLETLERSNPFLNAINLDYLVERIKGKQKKKAPIKLGVIACMPKLQILNINGNPTYEYGDAALKSNIDYRTSQIRLLMAQLSVLYDIPVELECVVANSEASIKYGDRLVQSREQVNNISQRVKRRIKRILPDAQITSISDYMPVDMLQSDIRFQNSYRKLLKSSRNNPLENKKIKNRYEALIRIGISEEIAIYEAVNDYCLQYSAYALEGFWINQNDWDAMLMIDGDQEAAQFYTDMTFQASGIENISILYVVENGKT